MNGSLSNKCHFIQLLRLKRIVSEFYRSNHDW